MIVELVSVGTEILLGNIVNTNASYLSEQCAKLGLSVYYQTVVGDNEDRLTETAKMALDRSDIVIFTGGLGPTKDDITKEVVSRIMEKELVEDENAKAKIKAFFRDKEIPENNWKQAMVPTGAMVLDNENGTAPGIIIENKGKTAILLPGPPNEMIPMFEDKVFEYLNNLVPETIYSRMVKVCNVEESKAELMVKDLIDNQTNPTIAPYAKTGEVHFRITAKAASKEEAKELIKPVVKELKKRFGRDVYTTKEKETLEESVIKLLKKYDLTVSTAESCTGGKIAATLVNVSGASSVFKEGYVTYSNRAKRKLLGVEKETLRKYGAVSEQTACEMALGGMDSAAADVCVSATGIAGPGGGTPEKPVGLVYIGCCVNGDISYRKYIFNGNRSKVREQTVVKALTLLRDSILDYYGE